MSTRRTPVFVELSLGPLPAGQINRTLGHDLEAGEVVFSAAAQAHAFKRHGSDFQRCLPHLGGVVASPHYMGDDFKNPGKIELVARVPSLGSGVLVAISVEKDEAGRYNVCSLYPVAEKKIENRRQKQYLLIPKK